MRHFNEQQLQAIHAANTNVVVSASAGSGKTTVLIARLKKRILEDRLTIHEICAMTFTEKAAGEMKKRLLAELNQEYQRNHDPFVHSQIMLVETADISTIHAFCLKLIKNYGYIIGINPLRTQNIISEGQQKLFQSKAMQQTLASWLSHKPEAIEALMEAMTRNPLNQEQLIKAVLTCAGWLQDRKDPLKAQLETISNYQIHGFDDLSAVLKSVFFDQWQTQLTHLKDLLMQLIDHVDAIHHDTPQHTYAAHYLKILKTVQATLAKVKDHDISFYTTFLTDFDFATKPIRSDGKHNQLRDNLVMVLSEMARNYRPLDQHIELLNNQAPILRSLFQLTNDYLDCYGLIKEQNQCLDFNDFEHFALKILNANDQQIARLLRQKYREIMVDEFQDTNEHQDEIVRLISSGANVFRVGDIKQSIYRFRGAQPRIMQSLMHERDVENVYLSYNYRSQEPIVQYTNHVFQQVMNLTKGIAYQTHDVVEVGTPRQKQSNQPVEILVVENKDKENTNALKARTIAQKIITLHRQGTPFKDITILVRNHGVKSILKEALTQALIPHFIAEQSGFYNSPIIFDILSLLNYTVHGDDHTLINVLSSVFFAYTADDLARLKLSGTSFKEALKRLHPDDFKTLGTLTRQFRNQDIVSTLQTIIALRDGYNQRLSLQEKTNVDLLLEKASQYQQTVNASMSGFLHYIKETSDSTSSEAIALSENDDVVSVMTIHQAKGLEFPVVIFWTMKSRQMLDHKDMVLQDDDLGIALNFLQQPLGVTYKNLLRTAVEFKQNDEDLEEYLRLLYVALTRAQDHLIIVDVVTSYTEQSLDLYHLYYHKSVLDLLLSVSTGHQKILTIPSASIANEQLFQPVSVPPSFTFETPLAPLAKAVPAPVNNGPLDFQKHRGLAYGTHVHQAVEKLPHRPWTTADLIPYQEYREPLMRYNQDLLTQQLYAYPIIEHEMPFLVHHEEKPLAGIIDFYAQNDREIILVDFKSDAMTPSSLKTHYLDQVMKYKHALGLIYPEHAITSYIYSFYNNRYIPID